VCVAYEWHRSRVQWEMQLGDANIICMCVYVCVYVDQYSLHQLYTALHSTPKIAWCDLLIALLALSSDVEKRAREASAAAGEPEPRYIHVLSDPYSLTHTLYSILYTLYSILYTLYSILYTLYSILYTLYSTLYTLYSLLTPHAL
jgi:hypothetical protein